jgi:hypothetical protein
MPKFGDLTISIAGQYCALKHHCNGHVSIQDNDKTVAWEGTLKPSPFSREYNVIIKYTIGTSPICVVTSPDLKELSIGRTIPHLYPNNTGIEGTKLCLYLPKNEKKKKRRASQWQSTDFIADSIIPWASLWLFYFEDWLFSDDWEGGGEHPEIEEP